VYYAYTSRVANKNGWGPYSALGVPTQFWSSPQVFSGPSNVTVKYGSGTNNSYSATVSWSPVPGGQSGIFGINRYRVTSQPGNLQCSTADWSQTSCVINNLIDNAYPLTGNASSGSSVITGVNTSQVVPQMSIRGAACIPEGDVIIAVGDTTITLAKPVTCDVVNEPFTAAQHYQFYVEALAQFYSPAAVGVTATYGSGSYTVSLNSTANVFAQEAILNSMCIPNDDTITSIVGNTITLSNPTTCALTNEGINIVGAGWSTYGTNVAPFNVMVGPSAPTSVSASTQRGVSGSVSWTAPTDNGGSAILGYCVIPTPSPNAVTHKPNGPCSINASQSADSVFTVTGVTSVPLVVPYFNGAPGQNVNVYRADGAFIQGIDCANGKACSATGLDPAQTYHFELYHYMDANNVQWVDDGPLQVKSPSVISWTAPANNGSAVTSYTATARSSDGTVTMTCTTTALRCTIGYPSANYQWSYSVSATNAYGTTSSDGWYFAGSATSAAISGLSNNVSYTFTVIPNNAYGEGVSSAPSNSTSYSAGPGIPSGIQVQATGSPVGSSITVSWTAPTDNGGAAITGYTVTATNTAPDGSSSNYYCRSATTNCVFTGSTMPGGAAYSFTVVGTNSNGDGEASSQYPQTCTQSGGSSSAGSAPVAPDCVVAPIKLYSVPSPVAMTASGGHNKLYVTWSPPTNLGGSPLISYTATATPGGASCSVAANLLSSDGNLLTGFAPSCFITGLIDGSTYSVVVTATNYYGTSSSLTASAKPANVPDPPSIFDPRKVLQSAVISWPAYVGVGSITKYVATSTDGLYTCTSTTTSCTISGLLGGVTYRFNVVATASVPQTVVGTPSWSAVSGAENYVVTTTGALTCQSSSTSCSISGMTGGQTYLLQVQAQKLSTGIYSGPISWPAYSGGTALTYTVSNGSTVLCTSSGTSCNVTGLVGRTSYSLSVSVYALTMTRRCIGNFFGSCLGYVDVPSYGTVVMSPVAFTAPASAPLTASTVSYTAPPATYVAQEFSNGTTSATVPVPAGTIQNSDLTGGVWIYAVPATTAPSTTSITATLNGVATTCSLVATQYKCFWQTTNGVVPSYSVVGVGSAGASGPANYVGTAIGGYSSAPQNVSATITGNGVAKIQWSYPVNDGSSTFASGSANGNNAITSFVVTSTPGNLTCTGVGSGATSCSISGLTAGLSYTFSVVAINPLGFAVASSVGGAFSSAISNAVVPGSSTGVVAVSGNGTAVVSWTAPVGYTGVTYRVSSTPGNLTCTTSALTCTVVGLSNGTAYSFVVTTLVGTTSNGVSQATLSVIPATGPTAPSGVTAVLSNVSALISFTGSVSNGGSPIVQYLVTSSPGGLTCTTMPQTGSTSLSCSIGNLVKGTSYTFSVVAQNLVGGAVLSSTAAVSSAVTPQPIPDTPSNVVATPGDGLVVVTWNVPNAYGQVITGYTVSVSPGTGGCTTTSNSCVINGLTDGTVYSFSVTASDSFGTSNAGFSTPTAPVNPFAASSVVASIAATTSRNALVVSWTASALSTAGYTVVAVPNSGASLTCSTTALTCVLTGAAFGKNYVITVSAVTATTPVVLASTTIASASSDGVVTTGQAVVAWSTPPSPNDGTSITGYTVTSVPALPTPAACTNVVALTCIFTGLNNGTAYSFVVTATYGSGRTAVSTPSTQFQLPTAPDAPSVVSLAPDNGSVNVGWSSPNNRGSNISSYVVTSSPGNFTCTVFTSVSGLTNCTVLGLSNNQRYTFSVVATNGIGTSSSSAASATATPGSVTSVTATVGFGRSTIAWVASTQSLAVSGYLVTSSPGGYTCTAPSSASACTITGLTNGVVYTFVVTTSFATGVSASSLSSDPTTPGYTVPDAPTNVTVTAGSGVANVSWSAPLNTGGTAVSSYIVTASDTTLAPCIVDGATLACQFIGLTNGQSYTFTVSAANDTGMGVPSTSSQAVRPVGAPSAPTLVTTTVVGTSLLVSWTASLAQGSPVSAYNVTAVPDSGATLTCTSVTTSCTLGAPQIGVKYSITVTATNSLGTSAASTLVIGVVAIAPSAPLNVIGLAGNGIAIVTWTAPATKGGAVLTTYTATAYSSSNTVVGTCTATSMDGIADAATSCLISALSNGAAYRFSVVATNSVGSSPVSAISVAVVPLAIYQSPGTIQLNSVLISNIASTSLVGISGTGAIAIGSTLIPVTITYSSASSWSYSASGTASLFGISSNAFNTSGTVVASSASSASGSIQITLANPAVANGVTISSMALTFSATGVLAGSGTLTIGSSVVNASLNFYAGSGSWQIDLVGSPSITLASGLVLSSVSGSLISGQTLNLSGVVSVGGITLTGTLLYTSSSNWSLSPTGFTTISLFAPALTSQFLSGSITNANGVVSGGWAATFGTVVLAGQTVNNLVINLLAGGAMSASGSISVGSGSNTSFNLSTFAYLSASSWTIGATAERLNLDGVTLSNATASLTNAPSPSFVVNGSLTLTTGVVVPVTTSVTGVDNWTMSIVSGTRVSLFAPATSNPASGTISAVNGFVSGQFSFGDFGQQILSPSLTVSEMLVTWDPLLGLVGTGNGVLVGFTSASTWTTSTPGAGITLSGTITLGGLNFSNLVAGLFPGSFTAQVSIAGVNFGASIRYVNQNNWTFTITGSGSIFGSSFTASGTVSTSSGAASGSLSLSASSVSLGGLTISSPSLTVSPLGAVSFSGSTSLFSASVAVTGSFVVSSDGITGAWNLALSTTGNLNLASGVSLSGVKGTLSTNSTPAVTLQGKLTIFGTSLAMSVVYTSSSNWSLTASAAAGTAYNFFGGAVSIVTPQSGPSQISGTLTYSSDLSGSLQFNLGATTLYGVGFDALTLSLTYVGSALVLSGSGTTSASATPSSASATIHYATATTATAAFVGTSGSTVVTLSPVSSALTSSLVVGEPVTGAGIPFGTTIVSIAGGTITLSNALTASTTAAVTLSLDYSSGSSTVTVSSLSGISVGTAVVSDSDLPAGTYVKSLAGTAGNYTVTLSQAFTASGSTQSVSFFPSGLASFVAWEIYGTASGSTLDITPVSASFSLPSSLTLMPGVTLSNITATAGLTNTGSGTLTVGGSSFAASITYSDPNDWSLSVTSSPVFFGANFAATGTISDLAGTISGSLTLSAANVTLGATTVTSATISISASGAVSFGGSMSFGSASLVVAGTYSGSWTITLSSPTTLTPFSGLSISNITGTLSTSSSSITISALLALGTAGTISVSISGSSNLNFTIAIVGTGTFTLFANTSLATTMPLSALTSTLSGSIGSNPSIPNLSGSLTITMPASTSIPLGAGVSISAATFTFNTQMKLSGSVTVNFGSSVGSLTGTFAYNSATDYSMSLVSGPLTLPGGFKLTASGAYSSTSGVTTLTGTLSVAGATVTTSVSYKDSQNWTITGSGSVTLLSTLFSVSGNLTNASGRTTGSLNFATTGTSTISGVSMTAPSASLSPTGAFNGTASISIGSSATVSLTVVYTPGSGSNAGTWLLTVAANSVVLVPNVMTLTSLTGVLTYPAPASGAPLVISASLKVLTSQITIQLNFTSLNSWNLSAVGTTGSITLFNVLTIPSGNVSGQFSYNGRLTGSLSFTMPSSPLPTVGLFQISGLVLNMNADGTFTGAATLNLGSVGSLSIAVSYVSSTNYTFTVSSGSLSLGGGFTVTNIAGTVASGAPLTATGTINVGGCSLTVAVSYSSSTLWSVTAAGGCSFFGLTTVFTGSGSLSKSVAGLAGSVTFALGTQTFAGLTFTGLAPSTNFTVTYTIGGGVVAAGSVLIGSANGSLNANFTYVSSSNWSINVATPVGGSLSVGSGVTITAVSGSATYNGSLNLSFTGTMAIGDASITLTAAYQNTQNWSLAATGVISAFGVTATVSGSISDSSGTISSSIQASLSPMTLAGVTVSNITLTWSNTTGLGGTATISMGSSVTLNLSISYQDSNNWSLRANGANGPLNIVPGFITLPAANYTGAITKSKGVGTAPATYAYSIAVNIPGSITLIPSATGSGTPILSVSNVTFLYANSAPMFNGNAVAVNGTNTSYFSATGSATLSLGSGLPSVNNVSWFAAYGMQSGAFTLIGSLGSSLSIPGTSIISLASPMITVTYGAGSKAPSAGSGVTLPANSGSSSGFSIALSGIVTLGSPLPSASLPVTLTYANGGFVVAASFGNEGLNFGKIGASLQTLAYTSVATTMTLSGLSIAVPAKAIVFGGTFSLPTWVTNLLGVSAAPLKLNFMYASPTNYSMSAVIPMRVPIPTGSSSYTFSFTSFTFSLVQTGDNFIQSMTMSGQFIVSNGPTIGIQASLSFNASGATLTGSFTAANPDGSPIWPNAMGFTGFNIISFTIQVGIQLGAVPFPLPTLGLQATAQLPNNILAPLGISTNNLGVSVLMNVSEANPCIDVAIGSLVNGKVVDNHTPVINIDGVISANYADFILAPTGCVVGPYTVAPGFAIDFTGAFMSVPVTFNMSLTPSPFKFAASATIGPFSAGPVNFAGASVAVAYDSSTGAGSASFSGAITIIGTTLTLTGSASIDAKGNRAMSLSGALSNISYAGFSLTNMTFGASYNSANGGTFTINGTGKINILGSVLDVKQFTVTYTAGVITECHIDIAANINVANVVAVSGDFVLDLNTFAGTASLSLTNGNATIQGFGLTNVNLQIDARSGFSFSGQLNIANVVQATLAGQMYWAAPASGTMITNAAGVQVAAQAGNFYFSANPVSITIGSFSTQGQVTIGNVGGTQWASFAVSIALDNHGSNAIAISGSFSSNGNFALAGSGSLNLAGFSLQVNVAASKTNGDISVSASGAINIQGLSASLSGQFSKSSQGISATMSAALDVNIGGFDFGNGTMTMAIAPGSESFSLNVGIHNAIFNGTMTGTFVNRNGVVGFYFNVGAGIYIPGVSISGSLTITNCTESTCGTISSFSVTLGASFSAGGKNFSFNVGINPNFSFSVNSSGSFYGCTGDINFGLMKVNACMGGAYYVALSSSSPYVTFSTNMQASINVGWWYLDIGCHSGWVWVHCWCNSGYNNWSSLSIGVGIDSSGHLWGSYNGWSFNLYI